MLASATVARIETILEPHLGPFESASWWARADRAAGELSALFEALFGDDAPRLLDAVFVAVAQATARRPVDLRAMDARRQATPDWFHAPDRVGYVAYVSRLCGTLAAVAEHLDYLEELGVNYLHLMSVLRARDGQNDGGYAVVDYADVDPRLGTWDDLVNLTTALRQRGISPCIDVVVNHTAYEHRWAKAARAGDPRYRQFYLMFPDRTMPDRYEETLPEVFPQMAPGNFTWDADAAAWVWTTFNSYQWDLNYANPDVFVEMLEVMLTLANAGVEVLRIDAVAFTWKRLGTNCQNQPEAHYLAQAFRSLLDVAAPGVLVKAEAIVAPSDLSAYLGAYPSERRECHLAYHNQLMVMLWSSIASGETRLAAASLASLAATPVDAAFCTYVRCHDDIGWAVDDALAASVGLDGPAHRAFLAAFYRGDFPDSFAAGVAFSTNDDVGDERTCGTTAELCGVQKALRSGSVHELDLAVRRIELLYGVSLGFGGIPLIYMGDELGIGNDEDYAVDVLHADDSRWIHRPQMDWSGASRRHSAGSVEQRVFESFRRLLSARRGAAALSTGGRTYIAAYDDPAILAWVREHDVHGRLLGVANVAARHARLPFEALAWCGIEEATDLLGWRDIRRDSKELVVAPYGVAWFTDAGTSALQPPPVGSARTV